MNTSNELLKELRIDRSEAPPPRHGVWIGLAVVVAVLALGGAAWAFFGRDSAPELRMAPVIKLGTGSRGAVLDASGYVVARRVATVSAKITGKVREVLIEEGQAVKAGQVLATLDLVDADAQLALSKAQLAVAKKQGDQQLVVLLEAQIASKRKQEK